LRPIYGDRRDALLQVCIQAVAKKIGVSS